MLQNDLCALGFQSVLKVTGHSLRDEAMPHTHRAPMEGSTHLGAAGGKVLELRGSRCQVRVCLWSELFIEQLHFVQF